MSLVLRRFALPTLLVALTIAMHADGLRNGFVWDDEWIIVENTELRDLSRAPAVLLAPDEVRPYYRPLNRLSYFLDAQFFGLQPAGWHAVNLGLHAANVLLLFLLAKRLFGDPAPATLAALLLAVHPIHVEAVAFVTARNNLLALMFVLTALILHLDARSRGSVAREWLSGMAFFGGLLSKEQALMVLPVMALAPYLLGARTDRNTWRSLVPHAAALVCYSMLRTVALEGFGTPGLFEGLTERLSQNLVILPRYLWLLVYPRDLTIFHAWPAEDPLALWLRIALWAAATAAVGYLAWRRAPASNLGLIWLGFNLLPLAQIVPIPSAPIAERYFYIPAVGIWLVVAELARRLADTPRRRRVAITVALVLVVLLGARSVRRTADWRDDVSLARSAAEVDPHSVRALRNLGVALMDRGDSDGARIAWEAALRVADDDAETLTQLGTLEAVSGRFDEAEQFLRRAVQSDPGVAIAHLNLARLLERSGRSAEARVHYEAFIDIGDPFYREFLPLAEDRVRALSGIRK